MLRRPSCWLPLVLVACQAPPPPPPPPPPVFTVAVERFAGPALAGPVASTLAPAPDVPAAPAVEAMVTLTLLPQATAGAEALARHGRAVVRGNREQPFGSHPRALGAVQLLAAAAAGEPVARQVALLPTGATTVLHVRADAADTPLPRLLLSRPQAAAVQVALASGAGEGDGEQVLLDRELAVGAPPLQLWLPATAHLPALQLQVLCRPASGDAASIAGELAAATAAADAAIAPLDPAALALQAQVQMFDHLVAAEDRRFVLAALAQRLAVRCAADFAMVADAAALGRLQPELAALPALPEATQPFALERAVLLAVLPGLQRDELPPEQTALLLRWCGAVGRHAATLQEVLQASTDAAGYTARLRAENRECLADSDPATRVQAHDWLQQHGAAVPGFDPLADPAARRRALAAAETGTPEGR